MVGIVLPVPLVGQKLFSDAAHHSGEDSRARRLQAEVVLRDDVLVTAVHGDLKATPPLIAHL